MRATPKTSSPIGLVLSIARGISRTELTFADLGTKRDVLSRSTLYLLLGRHFEKSMCVSAEAIEVGIEEKQLDGDLQPCEMLA